jgi:hypothetical protein
MDGRHCTDDRRVRDIGGMSRPCRLFLVISDAPVSLLSELVRTTHLVMKGCFWTTHLWEWTMSGLRLGRFIKVILNGAVVLPFCRFV